MLADDWWFWVITALVVAGSVLGSRRYRALAAAARRLALERGLVEPGPGRHVVAEEGGFWSDLSWLSLPLGVWVAIGPWVWGYDDVRGAVTTDVVTGAAVVLATLVGIALPSITALNVLAGLWLVAAPWLVGYGDEGGPVGLSDTSAGIAIASLAIAGLAAATRRVAPGETGPIGRVRRRP
jgi:SPW repeat-containing protein